MSLLLHFIYACIEQKGFVYLHTFYRKVLKLIMDELYFDRWNSNVFKTFEKKL